MRAQVRRTIERDGLIRRAEHVLVACSGGPDSVALVHVLHGLRRDLGFTLCVASVDHGLRAAAADEVRAVGAFAEGLGLRFVPLRVEVPSGASVQGQARKVRYAALCTAAAEQQATRIAMGHTQDDQAETLLARLLRGSGLEGLAGIQRVRDDGVIRPLLDCTREEVRTYVALHQLPTIDDPTNLDERFLRVRIRRRLLPLLHKEDPQLTRHLAELADEAAQYAAWLQAACAELGGFEQRRISVNALAALAAPVRRAWIAGWLEYHLQSSPSRAHREQLEALLRGHGEVLLGKGWTALIEGSDLILKPGS